jgi:hypothetical protein
MFIAPVIDNVPTQSSEDQETVDGGECEETKRYRNISGA